jgi:dihydroneopterin aldolase
MVYLNWEQMNKQTFFLNRYLDEDNNHLYTQYNDMYHLHYEIYNENTNTFMDLNTWTQ